MAALRAMTSKGRVDRPPREMTRFACLYLRFLTVPTQTETPTHRPAQDILKKRFTRVR